MEGKSCTFIQCVGATHVYTLTYVYDILHLPHRCTMGDAENCNLRPET